MEFKQNYRFQPNSQDNPSKFHLQISPQNRRFTSFKFELAPAPNIKNINRTPESSYTGSGSSKENSPCSDSYESILVQNFKPQPKGNQMLFSSTEQRRSLNINPKRSERQFSCTQTQNEFQSSIQQIKTSSSANDLKFRSRSTDYIVRVKRAIPKTPHTDSLKSFFDEINDALEKRNRLPDSLIYNLPDIMQVFLTFKELPNIPELFLEISEEMLKELMSILATSKRQATQRLKFNLRAILQCFDASSSEQIASIYQYNKREKEFAKIEQEFQTVISGISMRQLNSIKRINQPKPELVTVGYALLTLVSEIDHSVDVTSAQKVMSSRAWQATLSYINKPGHVIQTLRAYPDFVKQRKISTHIIKKTQKIIAPLADKKLFGIEPTGIVENLYRFISTAVNYYESCIEYKEFVTINKLKSIGRRGKSNERFPVCRRTLRPEGNSQATSRPNESKLSPLPAAWDVEDTARFSSLFASPFEQNSVQSTLAEETSRQYELHRPGIDSKFEFTGKGDFEGKKVFESQIQSLAIDMSVEQMSVPTDNTPKFTEMTCDIEGYEDCQGGDLKKGGGELEFKAQQVLGWGFEDRNVDEVRKEQEIVDFSLQSSMKFSDSQMCLGKTKGQDKDQSASIGQQIRKREFQVEQAQSYPVRVKKFQDQQYVAYGKPTVTNIINKLRQLKNTLPSNHFQSPTTYSELSSPSRSPSPKKRPIIQQITKPSFPSSHLLKLTQLQIQREKRNLQILLDRYKLDDLQQVIMLLIHQHIRYTSINPIRFPTIRAKQFSRNHSQLQYNLMQLSQRLFILRQTFRNFMSQISSPGLQSAPIQSLRQHSSFLQLKFKGILCDFLGPDLQGEVVSLASGDGTYQQVVGQKAHYKKWQTEITVALGFNLIPHIRFGRRRCSGSSCWWGGIRLQFRSRNMGAGRS